MLSFRLNYWPIGADTLPTTSRCKTGGAHARRATPADEPFLMEVRPTVSHSARGEVGPAVASSRGDAEPDDQLSRMTAMAAHVLGVPVVRIYLDGHEAMRARRARHHDAFDDFVARIDLSTAASRPVVLEHDDESVGGDGAVIRSFAAFPIRSRCGAEGHFCVGDYRERSFGPDELALMERFVSLAEADLEQQSALLQLQFSEQRFRAVTENALDAVVIVDRFGGFRYVSDSAFSVLGIRAREATDRRIVDGVLEEDLENLERAFSSASGDGDLLETEVRYITPGGALRHLRLRGRNLLGSPGVGGFLVHIRDATERIRLEEELRTSRDRAEEMNRLKSVFLTNMSHEVRTPLTTILGFAEILEGEVHADQRRFVRLIRQGGVRLLDTLTSILDLARLESRSFDVVPQEFDVVRKVLETCQLLEPLAREKGLYLSVKTPEEPAMALLDVSALERIVSNLVRNGIKFTSQGGVTLTLEVDDDDIVLHVADTGIGMSKEFMPFLFEEFKQESEGFSRIHEGNGLGLPITKRLVELMRGDIMAESEKGTGSVFTVVLPRNGVSAHEGEETGRTRVLVVEDNADTRTLVNHLLRKSYEIVCASDGEEALRLAGESRFEALLVDINLGKGKSGEDVLHAIKALPGYDGVPVVAVTAYAMPGDRERFFSEGFDEYVSKPFSKQRLLEALEGVLQN